jgi:nitroreductase
VDSSADRRAREIEAQMTDDERFALIISIMGANDVLPVRDRGIPEGVPMSAGYAPGVPRLGVPPLPMSDASLGVTNPGLRPGGTATALPAGRPAVSWGVRSRHRRKRPKMGYQEFLDLVQRRRSTRSFTADPVPEDLVDQIIEAARWAPSGANSQPWEFVVVRDKEMKDRIAGFVTAHAHLAHEVELTRPEEMRWPSVARPVSEPGWKDAPVLIVVCGDPRTKQSYPLVTQLVRGDVTFNSSLAGAFLCMALAATSLGLGSQWASAASNAFVMPLIMEALGIPQDLVIYDMMALGHPAAQPRPRLVRARSEMTHIERFDQTKHRTDAQVKDFVVSLRK